jgi:flagellar hook protein FlgE
MASEISTIQSLKAVDAWIDVINANINGGVRTAFKSSRLKFAGSNVDVSRAGSSTSLPLQFPEPGLTTANTVIDFTQGAVTASTENGHLALQGTGFFVLIDPASVNMATGVGTITSTSHVYITRDGEFHANQAGVLVNANGYVLTTFALIGAAFDPASFRVVANDLDNPTATTPGAAVKLSTFLQNVTGGFVEMNGAPAGVQAVLKVSLGQQSLRYTSFGSTVFDMGFLSTCAVSPLHTIAYALQSDVTILNKSLEASNASMTQSVPELSLAQKLFSALTKVLQTKQTNVDGVLNLVR